LKRITISIDSKLDMKFRKKASQKYHFDRGWYSNAVQEAMTIWAEDKNEEINDNKSKSFKLKDNINSKFWDKINSDLNLDDNDLIGNIESLINHLNYDSEYQIKIERESDNIVIKFKNKRDFDIKANLESVLFLHHVLEVILSALEETSKEKFEIIGIGDLPEVYIKKINND